MRSGSATAHGPACGPGPDRSLQPSESTPCVSGQGGTKRSHLSRGCANENRAKRGALWFPALIVSNNPPAFRSHLQLWFSPWKDNTSIRVTDPVVKLLVNRLWGAGWSGGLLLPGANFLGFDILD